VTAKIQLKTHAAVLSRSGEKFYTVSPAGIVYATLCVEQAVTYSCITPEDDPSVLLPGDPLLDGALAVDSLEV
jgi:hypothetical protein